MTDSRSVNPASLSTHLLEKLPEIIIEAIFLTLAVLTAFAIDAWRVERQQKSDAAIAVTSIRAELLENQASNPKHPASFQLSRKVQRRLGTIAENSLHRLPDEARWFAQS